VVPKLWLRKVGGVGAKTWRYGGGELTSQATRLITYIVTTMVIGKSFAGSALRPWPYCGHNTTNNSFKVFCKHQAKESACRVSCYILIYRIFHVLEELNAEEITYDSAAHCAKNLCFDTKT
jgi:hypothetical protein